MLAGSRNDKASNINERFLARKNGVLPVREAKPWLKKSRTDFFSILIE